MNSDNPLFVDELCREIAHATPSPEVLNELCREMTIQRQSIVNIEPQLRRVTQQQPGTRTRSLIVASVLVIVLAFVVRNVTTETPHTTPIEQDVRNVTAATPDRNSRSSNRPAEYTLVAMAHGLYRQSSVAANAGVPVLQNPGFEAHTADKPAGWIFPPVCEQAGYRLELSTDAFAGQHAAHVSASSAKAQSFANLMQGFRENALDGFRGRRIRFRAAVKTQNLADTTKPGLWLRVDRRSTDPSRPVFGDFDNMQDRPIRSADWQHFEIVADVADDAVSLTVGLLLSGNGDAWIDDCSLEVVDDDTPKTTRDLTAQTSSVRSSSATAGSQSTRETFWTPWLWLAVGVIGIICCSQLPDSRFQLLAFRFTCAYWLLFALPSPLQVPVARIFPSLLVWYNQATDIAVRWIATKWLGIERELIPPNGSGDTTFDYVRLLLCITLAASIAVIWTAVDYRRKKNAPLVSDLLKSYVRWTLGIVILGYGMAKLGNTMNQFPEPDSVQLLKRYGDSSPMNLVWTFMGASRPYTFFAGAAEVIAGLLLLWRRTSTLGAIASAGVMLHVVLLNMCYDVPVKILSTHLFLMAVFLLLHDTQRLWKVLFKQEACERVDPGPFYSRQSWIWTHRVVKGVMLIWLVAVPAWQRIQLEYLSPVATAEKLALYGTYEVQSFLVNGNDQPLATEYPYRWQYVSFHAPPRFNPQAQSFASIQTLNGPPVYSPVVIDADKQFVEFTTGNTAGKYTFQIETDELMILTGDKTRIVLKRLRREDFLLINRGFRWVNEYPFNR